MMTIVTVDDDGDKNHDSGYNNNHGDGDRDDKEDYDG